MWERLARWWDLREDVRVLQGLDDRMLEDMGLTRGEIRPRVMARTEDGAYFVAVRPEPEEPSGEAVAC